MSDLTLNEEDQIFLDEKSYAYKQFLEKDIVLLVIKDFVFPSGFYIPDKADLLIKIRPGYPISPLDMFWTCPDIALKRGGFPDRTIPSQENRLDKKWQRWSRHYVNPWRPGIDNLRSFIQSIHIELKKGI